MYASRPPAVPLALAGVFLGVSLAASSARAQSTLPAGGEFRVSQYATGNQQKPAIAVGRDGSYFLAWESEFQDGSGFGIFGRRYSRAGAALGPEFQINQSTLSNQVQPAVAADGFGRYTVVWASDGPASDIFARQFTAAGPATPEFLVNPFPNGARTSPRVSAGPHGLAVVWEGPDGDRSGVFGRLLSPEGTPVGYETRLSAAITDSQSLPVVAWLPNERFVAAWRETSIFGIAPLIKSRLFDRWLLPLNDAVTIWDNESLTFRDHVNVVSMGLGTYSIGYWQAHQQTGKDYAIGWDYGVQVVDHGADGRPVEPRALVASGDMGDDVRYQSALAANNNMQLFMAYTSARGVLFCWDHFGDYPCPIVPAEDGSGASVFGRALGPGAYPVVFRVNTFTLGDQSRPAVAMDATGNSMIVWQSEGQDGSGNGIYAQRLGGLFPTGLAVQDGGNGVLEAGESAVVIPTWTNENGAAVAAGGTATYTGPAGGTYTLLDGQGGYGTIPNGAAQACVDCYGVQVSFPGPRPAPHVDTLLTEFLAPQALSLRKVWSLHIGGSFSDVTAASPYYRFAETLLHRGISNGCTATTFCPGSATTREQMAVFTLVAKEGAGYTPAACAGMFDDVPASSPFCPYVEEMARRGITGGCGGGNFCATAPVTREQMSVFMLRTLDPALSPPACTTPMFADVPAASPFCRWVEEMARRGISGGCGGGNFCPTAAVTREQMAVFLTTTFGLTLYGP